LPERRQMKGQEHVQNKRGLMGWLNPFHYNIERWAYVFQRVTGVVILLYVLGHLGDTSFFVGGPLGTGPNTASWAGDLSVTENIMGHSILALTVLVVVFHGINGIRLILSEYGVIFQKPTNIEYPYKAKGLRSMQKHLIWIAIAAAIIACLYSGTILFG
jgi:succinate dehydrogenase / fumarate reductase cytochrome b subunit